MPNNFLSVVFTLAILMFSPQGKAQEKDLKGLIVIDFNNTEGNDILITNQNTKVTAISDLTGSFKIKATVGDTLAFNGYFLEPRKFYVKKSSFDFDPLIIHMNQEIIELEDLIVKKPLTGDIEKDVKSVKIKDDIENLYKSLGIDIRTLDMEPREKKEDVIPKLGSIPIPISLNVEALFKSITGYYRKMETLRKFEKLETRLNGVKEHFGIKYFEETLGIPENEIRGYLLYCYDTSGGSYELYFKQKDFLSIDSILREKAKSFRKRLEERDKKK